MKTTRRLVPLAAILLVWSIASCNRSPFEPSSAGAWSGQLADGAILLFVSDDHGVLDGSGKMNDPRASLAVTGSRDGQLFQLQLLARTSDGLLHGFLYEGELRAGHLVGTVSGWGGRFDADPLILSHWPLAPR